MQKKYLINTFEMLYRITIPKQSNTVVINVTDNSPLLKKTATKNMSNALLIKEIIIHPISAYSKSFFIPLKMQINKIIA